MSNKVKVIQSRLSRRGVNLSLEEIREALRELAVPGIASNYGDVEVTDEMVSEIVQSLTGGAITANESAIELASEEKPELVTTPEEKEKIIASVAKEIDISLPVAAIKQIATSIDWAIASRSDLMKQLKVAIQSWAEHKVAQMSEELNKETDELLGTISQTISDSVESDNEHFSRKVKTLQSEIAQRIEAFRSSQAAILGIFKVPN
jgi:gas vesicle protein